MRGSALRENIKDFDPKINEENLSNCLQSLKDFDYDLSLRDIYCENGPNFVLRNTIHLNDGGILRDVKNYRKEKYAIRLKSSLASKPSIQSIYNYINFFKLAEKQII